MRSHRIPLPLPDSAGPGAPPCSRSASSHRFAQWLRFRTLLLVLVLPLSTLGVPALCAQSTIGWTLRSSSSADLWFHSVALTGFDAFGAVPLYQPGYATQVRSERERAGKAPTRLEREASAFQDAFTADPSFEVLHFVPIYFAAADVDQMLDALDSVAVDGERAAVKVPPVARFGAAAVASVLTTPQARATLARFVAAVREEWASAYRAERAAQSEERNAALQAASRMWAERTAPALASVLTAQSLDGGIILASPSLGPEGRFFAGRPGDRTDNLVAVRLALTPSAAGDPAWLAVREMSFPSAREKLSAAGALPYDSERAEQATGRAAAHLGAASLAPGGVTVIDAYRSALVRVLGQSVPAGGDALAGAFRSAYPMTASAATALGVGEY